MPMRSLIVLWRVEFLVGTDGISADVIPCFTGMIQNVASEFAHLYDRL